MKKTILLLAILALAGSVTASADPITDKINAYNAIRKKDINGKVEKSLIPDSSLTSDHSTTRDSDDTQGEQALTANATLTYNAIKVMQTVHDSLPSPEESNYGGYEDAYKQAKSVYDDAVKKSSDVYLDKNSNLLVNSDIKIRNLAHDAVLDYKRTTPNATQKELDGVHADSLKANEGIIRDLTVKYQQELQAARDAFDLNMDMVRSRDNR